MAQRDHGLGMEGPRLGGFCSHAIEGGWLACCVAVPLFFNVCTNSVFEPDKIAVFRSIVLVMVLAWIIRVLEKRAVLVHVSSTKACLSAHRLDAVSFIYLPVFSYALVWILATIASIAPRTSLWGSYQRRQGAYTIMSYVAFFLLVANGLKQRHQLERIFTVVLVGSALVAFYGILQQLNVDPLHWASDSIAPVLSTQGRSNYLAAYLVMLAPVALGRAIRGPRLARAGYTALLALLLSCLVVTLSRGAWLALLGGLLVFGFLLGVRRRSRALWIGTVTAATMAILFLVVLNLHVTGLQPFQELPYVSRLATLSETRSGSVAARLTIWRVTLQMIAARPFLGYGPDTFGLAFGRYYPPELVYYQGRETLVDRAHNCLLDLGVVVGLPGLAAYLVVIACFYSLALRALWRSQKLSEQVNVVAILSGMSGYLIQGQFNVDTATTYLLFWLFLAMSVALQTGLVSKVEAKTKQSLSGDVDPWQVRRQVLGRVISAVLVIGCALAVFSTNVVPVLADVQYARAVRSDSPEKRRHSIACARKAAALLPHEDTYRSFLAVSYLRRAQESGGERVWLGLGAREATHAIRLSPLDAAHWALLGQIYRYWGSTLDRAKFADAERASQKAISLNPGVAMWHRDLGATYYERGRYQAATQEFRLAIELDATDYYSYLYLGDTYIHVGRYEDAALAFMYARDIAKNSFLGYYGLGKAYFLQERFADAVKEYKKALNLDPTNPAIRKALGEAQRGVQQSSS